MSTTADLATIMSLHTEGKSPAEIASKYGVTPGTVRQRLIRAGCYNSEIGASKRGQRKFSEASERETLLIEYNLGSTISDLARKYGSCADTVRRTLREIGYVPRTRAESVSLGRKKAVLASPTKVSTEQLLEWHEEGMTLHEIGKRAGKTAQSIRYALLKTGKYRPLPIGKNSLAVGYHVDASGYVQVTDGATIAAFPYKEMCRSPRGTGRFPPVAKHRMIMAEHLGRALLATEQVHHIDGNKLNNTISNLQLRQRPHGNGVAMRCKCCGSTDLEPVPLA